MANFYYSRTCDKIVERVDTVDPETALTRIISKQVVPSIRPHDPIDNNTNENENDDHPSNDEITLDALHDACCYQAPLDVIQRIVTIDPTALRMRGKYGNLPLHLACQYNQSISVIQFLIDTYPEALHECDIQNGDNVIHLVCRYMPCYNNKNDPTIPLSVLHLLIKVDPTLVEQRNTNKEYPLHIACQYNQSEDVIRLLLKIYPEAVRKQNSYGFYPLDLATEYDQPVSVIHLLINRYPFAVCPLSRTERGELLYQYEYLLGTSFALSVCSYNPSDAIIQLLVTTMTHNQPMNTVPPPKPGPDWWSDEEMEEGIFYDYVPTNDEIMDTNPLLTNVVRIFRIFGLDTIANLIQSYYGDETFAVDNHWIRNEKLYDISLSCTNDQPIAYIRNLLETMPSEDYRFDSTRKQLCVELQNDYPDLDVINTMISYNPHLGNNPIDDMGNYILHRACLNNKATAYISIRQVIEEYIGLATKKNFYDNYPLHLACACNQHEEVMLLLVGANPIAVQRRNLKEYYPLHLACKYYHRNDAVIYLLAHSYPKALQYQTSRIKMPVDYESEFYRLIVNPTGYSTHVETSGLYPLHLACKYRQSIPVIQHLSTLYSTALQKKDDTGRLPLHWACECYHSEVLITFLVHEYPKAVRQKDSSGSYPIHIACQQNQSEAVIEFLFVNYKKAIDVRNMYGCYPLQYINPSQQTAFLLNFLASRITNAEQVATIVTQQQYPLHEAIEVNKSITEIQKIIDKYPLSIQQKDRTGLFPLHYACKNNPSYDIIELLCNNTEDGMYDRIDDGGYYPIHWASTNTQSTGAILKLLQEKFSVAPFFSQKGGCYPLHLGCKSGQPLPIIQYLYSISHDAIRKTNVVGYYPFHLACEYNQSYDVIEFLVQEYPEAVERCIPEDGMYPLHIACAYQQSLSVIQLLVSVYHPALSIPTIDGSYPLDLAVEAEASQEIIDFLKGESRKDAGE